MSRLTSLPRGTKVRASGLGPMSFRDFGGWVLLTNDWGRWQMLDKPDFDPGELEEIDHYAGDGGINIWATSSKE